MGILNREVMNGHTGSEDQVEAAQGVSPSELEGAPSKIQ